MENNKIVVNTNDKDYANLHEETDFVPNYQKKEDYNDAALIAMSESYKHIITTLGEDTEREGIVKTPMRVAKAMSFLTQGYNLSATDVLNSAKFKESYSEMVIVKDIELYSMCEHHMLPFFGKAHVAYIPNGYITGLSKLARVVDIYSRRMQVQERMTHQILEAVQEALNPLGVAVVIEAKHLCMMMRGVQKQNSSTTTSAFSGIFHTDEKTRKEFLQLVTAALH